MLRPRQTRRKTKSTRSTKLRPWIRKTRRRIGGFIFSIPALIAGLTTLASAAGTAAVGSVTAYGVNKLLKKIDGEGKGVPRRKRIQLRRKRY